MIPYAPGPGKERVLFAIKTKGPQTAAAIAKRLGITTMAVRQHLAALSEEQLVDFTDDRRKVGRPARLWRLTAKASERFHDSHAELAVGLLAAIKDSFGEAGLARLNEERTRQQIARYRERMPGAQAALEERVATLARLRREEGFMAEARNHRDGSYEMVENHCSIAKAAHSCPSLCGGELELFQAALGEQVAVARTAHLLGGDRCCSYSIRERTLPARRATGRG
jgi:predicted ArsR family transcriptional regulator